MALLEGWNQFCPSDRLYLSEFESFGQLRTRAHQLIQRVTHTLVLVPLGTCPNALGYKCPRVGAQQCGRQRADFCAETCSLFLCLSLNLVPETDFWPHMTSTIKTHLSHHRTPVPTGGKMHMTARSPLQDLLAFSCNSRTLMAFGRSLIESSGDAFNGFRASLVCKGTPVTSQHRAACPSSPNLIGFGGGAGYMHLNQVRQAVRMQAAPLGATM